MQNHNHSNTAWISIKSKDQCPTNVLNKNRCIQAGMNLMKEVTVAIGCLEIAKMEFLGWPWLVSTLGVQRVDFNGSVVRDYSWDQLLMGYCLGIDSLGMCQPAARDRLCDSAVLLHDYLLYVHMFGRWLRLHFFVRISENRGKAKA
uniref:Uncharacterized protein n=1 Tax=Lactuca sativa TaxID=4236 RepID=A0A9R1V9W0_LACSA|nr:hypothetical protein LSAT_V11C600322080 [Lactuca sativa]